MEAGFVGQEAVEWSCQPTYDMDEDLTISDPTLLAALPNLPFDTSTKVDGTLGKKIQGWLKECLSERLRSFTSLLTDFILVKIHNIPVWRSDTWRRFRIHPNRYFMNLPIDEDGSKLVLRSFSEVGLEEVAKWKEHLVASFATPTSSDRPFRFVVPTGTTPNLTKLRHKGDGKSKVSKATGN